MITPLLTFLQVFHILASSALERPKARRQRERFMTNYQHSIVRGLKMFYREAGAKESPTIVLLHGFPSSSHMFRDFSAVVLVARSGDALTEWVRDFVLPHESALQ